MARLLDRPIGQALAGALVLLLAAPAAAATDELLGMSLEELMSVRLRSMRLTGLHHTHDRGEWMVGLSTMHMHMDGHRSGTQRRGESEVLRDYMVAPTEMDMEMTMLHVMRGVSERWTLMAMLPYVRLTMDHVTRAGGHFTTRSHGLGDVKVGSVYRLWRSEEQRIDVTSLVSLPTGSISVKDDTPMGRVRLPYPMQLGSGTVDLRPGITWRSQSDRWSWGVHAGGWIRLHRNRYDYHLGHTAEATAWLARLLAPFLSASLRLDGSAWGDVSGDDDRLNPALVPTADPELRGGRRVDLLAGLNLFSERGVLAGHRLSIEGGVPVYQWLRGPQLETDYRWSAEWTWTF